MREMKMEPFINCKSTYLAYLYKRYWKDDDYLLFLKDKMIIENCIECYHENPWKHQPYIIGSRDGTSLYKNFREFMEERNFFTLQDVEQTAIRRICDEINGETFFFIANIDEKYLFSSKFYKKVHNSHAILLIKNTNDKILYLDSENGNIEEMFVEDLERAIVKKGEVGTKITIGQPKRKIKNEKMKDTLVLPKTIMKQIDQVCNKDIRYEAYRLMYSFQLIPYMRMLIKILEKEEVKVQIEELVRKMRIYTYIVLKNKIIRKKCDEICENMIIEINRKYLQIRGLLLNEIIK